MIEETLNYINNNYNSYKVCILGTTGTIKTGVYHNDNKAKNINFVYANEEEQNNIMQVITATKSDKDRAVIKNSLVNTVDNIKQREGDCLFVLACTELSLYFEDLNKEYHVIDAMDCLVNSAIIK